MKAQSEFLPPEVRINMALGTLLRYFNFLELNLGLCIRRLRHPGHVEKSHRWLLNSSIHEKIACFSKLMQQRGLVTNERELEAWCKTATEAPSLRNFYAHGIWEYNPLRKDAPVGFQVAPWRNESIKGSNSPTMTLESLEADAKAIRALFEEFMRLRQTYGV